MDPITDLFQTTAGRRLRGSCKAGSHRAVGAEERSKCRGTYRKRSCSDRRSPPYSLPILECFPAVAAGSVSRAFRTRYRLREVIASYLRREVPTRCGIIRGRSPGAFARSRTESGVR